MVITRIYKQCHTRIVREYKIFRTGSRLSGTGGTPLTQAQVEDSSSTIFGTVSGQRIWQAIAKWAESLTASNVAVVVDGFASFLQGVTPDSQSVFAALDSIFDAVRGVSRKTKRYSNLANTSISFSNMFDNLIWFNNANVALWLFGTGIIAAGAITLFADPPAGVERMAVIKIKFANAAAFDPLAWPIDANGKRPVFTAGAIYGWVFVTKNDDGLLYRWYEETA